MPVEDHGKGHQQRGIPCIFNSRGGDEEQQQLRILFYKLMYNSYTVKKEALGMKSIGAGQELIYRRRIDEDREETMI
jgi:hypothetical protein